VVVPLEAPAPSGFTVMVDGPLLAKLVARMPEEVRLEETGEQLRLLGGTFQAELRTCWRDLPTPRFSQGHAALPARSLRAALEAVRYAVSREEFRQVLTGVRLEVGETLRAVASDGYRLAIQEFPLPAPLPAFQGVLPSTAVGDLLRLLAGEETVQLSLEEQFCYCQGERFRYATPLLSGQFPDYRRVIPTNYPAQAEVGPELCAALERLEALADPDHRANHPVHLELREGSLWLHSQSDYGLAEETVPAVVRGELPRLSLNSRYLREALPAGRATLRFSGPTTPLLILGEEGYQALVMPLKT
jgi:DNA polymerase-3 subunit beta